MRQLQKNVTMWDIFENIYMIFCQQNAVSQQKPHTRLEIINGVLHQKLIFVDSPSDIVVSPTECVIFNDGSKSSGCAREEFKSFVCIFASLHNFSVWIHFIYINDLYKPELKPFELIPGFGKFNFVGAGLLTALRNELPFNY